MNDLGIALICSALQVTLFGSMASMLYLCASRRGPAAAARVAALTLGLCIVLTLVAVCPLPSWWSWQQLLGRPTSVPQPAQGADVETSVSSVETPIPSSEKVSPTAGESPWMGWSLVRLRQAWEDLSQQRFDTETSTSCWPRIVSIVFLSVAGLSLLRLGVGLWSVSCYRRRSRPIADTLPQDLLASLRMAMGCPRRVEVRESPDLSTPATIGWRRPLILLSANWCTWTEDELRAVLAHELAHVCRFDYAAGLLARISVAVHFYHPLVYWLAGRLQLQQELAADALGAACSGGRERYLRALARLLLREDARPPSWPARAFLSSSGTLLRRIHMLGVKNGSRRRRLPRSATAFLVIVLTLAGVGISALRGPAQQMKDIRVDVQENSTGSLIFGVGVNSDSGLTGQISLNERNFDIQSRSNVEPSRPAPFDLTYLSPDAPGVLALRPAAFFRRLGMERFAALVEEQIAPILAACNLPKDSAPPIEAIEQVIGEAQFGHDDKAPKGQRNQMMFSLTMIRTEKDFDWKKLMQALVPDAEKVRYRGKVYYKGELKAIGLKFDLCYYMPDGRTVVLHTEKVMRQVLDNLAGQRMAFAWASDWKRVEGGLMAVAYDMSRARKIIKDADPEIDPLIERTTHFVVGVDLRDVFAVQAFATCPDEKSAESLTKWARSHLAEEIATLDEKQRKNPNPKLAADRLAEALLKNARVARQGEKASLRTQAKINLAELGKMLMSFGMSSK
jgi:beta-lactamase regulating signal transducer with metallopeptidase domain